jgi:hypothetical protein
MRGPVLLIALCEGPFGGESAHARRGTAHSSQHGKAAGAFAEAAIRSVELIVQPDAHDVVGSGEAINGPRRNERHVGFAPDNRHPSGRPKIDA